MNNKNNKKIFGIVAGVLIFIVVIAMFVSIGSSSEDKTSGKSLEQLLDKLESNVTEAELKKASISLDDTSLYDELPEIEKYPLAIDGRADIDIEIFTSGEKAGTDTDSWLIECAKNFNNGGYVTSDGQTISISVRSVSSGLAADYIISGKYYPDLYTPSNELFGDYAIAQGGKLELYNNRLVGNTAGILVKNGSEYNDIDSIIQAVCDGKLNIGYTNPQTSATGLNLLIEILKSADSSNMFSDTAIEKFTKFNDNIPFVAYTTQQMRDSASNGSLDGMVTEYQAYINDKTLSKAYTFIAFGQRHDNPLYIVNKGDKTASELEAIQIINDYLTGTECQNIATKDGFNANNDVKSDYTTNGTEITDALKVYKSNKDAGKDIIAVFVADCSGSMSGDAILQLKESLTNGMNYINSNNYVGLVSYANDVTIEVPIAEFDLNQKAYFQGAINSLNANGGTSTYEAVVVALDMINKALVDHPDAKPMLFVLSDGCANGKYRISDIEFALRQSEIPVYTIGYTSEADTAQLSQLSGINEAATISADSDDVIYKIKSLFNSQL